MVVELGMSHLGEISTLTKIAKPTIAIITNVGTAHIGNLGSRENILKAKMEIIEGLQNNGTLIINNDNDLLHKWNLENNHKINVITYGIQNKSNVMAYNIQQNEKGSTFNTKVEEQEYNVKVKIGGEHFVYNSLCAIAVGLKLGINIEKIIRMSGILHLFCMSVIIHDEKRKENKDNLDVWTKKDKNNTSSGKLYFF